MSKKERNNYCRLSTYYDKTFKGKVTTLKLCDNLYLKLKSNNFDYNKIFYEQDNYLITSTCPFCGNNLV